MKVQKYMTINEAAAVLSVHPNTIRNHLTRFGAVDINGGESPNRCIRIPERALENYLQQCTIREGGRDSERK